MLLTHYNTNYIFVYILFMRRLNNCLENKKYTMSSIAPYGIIDVVGAGDTFVGTYLHCINNNIEIKEALKWSTTAAGIKIGGRSITSQPESIEIQKHLSKVIIEQGGIDA